MLRIQQLRLPVGHSREELERKVQKLLGCQEKPEITIVRRSLDARKKPVLFFNYLLDIHVKNQEKVYHNRKCNKKQVIVYEETPYQFPVSGYEGKERPVIIGTGPAGLFCGYMLARAGFRPILLERGRPVTQRLKDVVEFWESGCLNPESNVQFGEGGAGTFSDGKLNTLVKDKYGRNREVLSIFVKAGAPEEILYEQKPHIGTDVLSRVVENLRHSIEAWGGEFHFEAKVTAIEVEKNRICGVRVNGKERLAASYVILAPGHSARDTFQMLYEAGVRMEAKPFAVGMRVEHPQRLINLSQYGVEEQKLLGNASYKLTAQTTEGRGVYSFCMCPGGYVVNASSTEGYLAVNGMSYSGRNGKNANSAIIIGVSPKDYGSSHPLAGVAFQKSLEKKAYQLAKGKVPVERYGDYRNAVLGERFDEAGGKTAEEAEQFMEDLEPCIKGNWCYEKVHELLPLNLRKAFVEGMEQFGNQIKGFNNSRVLIEGIESRTSSPVRILRDETLQASVRGLYPCGEGAGYAGGITSAAMDGIHVAEEVARHIIELTK